MGKITLILFYFLFSCLSLANDQEISPIDIIRSNFTKYAKDPQNLIKKDFTIPKDLESRVQFWFSAYTLYPSNSIILHDKENLELVYDIIDFNQLEKSELHVFTKDALQDRIVNERIKKFKDALSYLERGKRLNNPIENKILRALKKVNFDIPKSRSARRRFFRGLKNNFRTQTGQKDFISQGLHNIKPYRDTIEKYFEIYELPHELLAIPFLESSFTLHARSKVEAAGPWQFMPSMGDHFMRISSIQDHRLNPLIATNGALHLLAQNKQILDKWDLAVSAYNNGTGLILKGIRYVKKRKKISDPDLQDLIKYYRSSSFGFAAKNFYSEFIALVYTLAYQDKIFPDIPVHDDKFLNIYIAKCRVTHKYLTDLYKKSKVGFDELNIHLRSKRKSYPRNVYFTADFDLPESKFYKVPTSKMRRTFPRNWYKFISDQRCSKR